jgi:hypothetical protein
LRRLNTESIDRQSRSPRTTGCAGPDSGIGTSSAAGRPAIRWRTWVVAVSRESRLEFRASQLTTHDLLLTINAPRSPSPSSLSAPRTRPSVG